MKKNCIFILFLLLGISTFAQQQLTQTVRGTVTDKLTKQSLPGANVVVLDSGLFLGTSADNEGKFRIDRVPIGRYKIKATFIGYHDMVIAVNILSAKETVLEIELEESAITAGEVIIKASREKDKSLNEMAGVSARLFTIEETERYAGSRGDPARMAMNYAGVSGANDQRNDIIIRGNSPAGLLWRLEDIDIPNPNHYGSAGSTGGPVSMLNNNVLANSDFMTGAFPAEYGNALSGVFDLKMRSGNNEKHEYLGQIGFNGVELGVEGPFSKNHRSSYLANYRYSTLDFMDKIGMDMGTGGVPRYQDFCYKLNFPMKKGVLSIVGMGGTSEIAIIESNKKESSMYSPDGTDLYNGSDLLTSAISYTHFINTSTYTKFIVNGFYDNGHTRIDTLDASRQPHLFLKDNTINYRGSFNWILNKKFSKAVSMKTGVVYDLMAFDFKTKIWDTDLNDMRVLSNTTRKMEDAIPMVRAYNQWSLKLAKDLTFYPGLHLTWFGFTKKYSLEPRASVAWQVNALQKLSFGYGQHSKTQSMYTYLIETRLADGSYIKTNDDLDFTKAHHFVMTYDRTLSENLRFKAETYYQHIFNAPVDYLPTSWSSLNSGSGWGSDAGDSLVNKGTGDNYGVELTFERFFSKGMYYLLTLSLYESKYTASDNIERNTAFNGNYVVNGLIGKELELNKKSAVFVDLKFTVAGGKHYTPVDLALSQQAGTTVYDDTQTNAKQFPAYVKADFKLGYRMNGKKFTQEWQVYIENVTNHKNILMQTYSPTKNKVNNLYQLGVFPMMQYRIYF